MNELLTKFKLIKRTRAGRDAIGQIIYTESQKSVYGEIIPITRQEFMTAGQIGIEPERAFIISSFDYNGETLAEIDGQRFKIYRVYPRSANETELYLTYASGANGGA